MLHDVITMGTWALSMLSLFVNIFFTTGPYVNNFVGMFCLWVSSEFANLVLL